MIPPSAGANRPPRPVQGQDSGFDMAFSGIFQGRREVEKPHGFGVLGVRVW